MSAYGVCYFASQGYLFQTAVSALQARRHSDSETQVYVVYVTGRDDIELAAFRRVFDYAGVHVISASADFLQGHHPMFGRLFMDQVLPAEVDQILYLDGDTQVVGDISPLVRADAPHDGAIAVRDPMLFIRQATPAVGRRIDGWWDESGISASLRANYVNSGVIRYSRAFAKDLREASLLHFERGGASLHFADQDAINLALDGRIEIASVQWNFPGFLLGTAMERAVSPRIIHFMSDPRPWFAALPPWGAAHFAPYEQIVHDYPEIAPYWVRPSVPRMAKYALQQLYKGWTERRPWSSKQAYESAVALERDVAI